MPDDVREQFAALLEAEAVGDEGRLREHGGHPRSRAYREDRLRGLREAARAVRGAEGPLLFVLSWVWENVYTNVVPCDEYDDDGMRANLAWLACETIPREIPDARIDDLLGSLDDIAWGHDPDRPRLPIGRLDAELRAAVRAWLASPAVALSEAPPDA